MVLGFGKKDIFYAGGKLRPGETRVQKNFRLGWKPKGFLIDENTAMSNEDIELFPQFKIMNSKKKFKRGTDDRLLIQWVKDSGWVLVTKDIRMAIRALMEGTPVLMINEDYKIISLMETKVHPIKEYKELFNYFVKRYEF